jgi:hypothetical protein
MPEEQRSHVTDSFSSLLPSGIELVKSQIGRSLKLARFYNTHLPDCNNVILEERYKKWHQSYSNKTVPGIPQKTAIGALGQCGENYCPNVFVLPKNIRNSTI